MWDMKKEERAPQKKLVNAFYGLSKDMDPGQQANL
jgi:hypothetical protein